MKNLSLVLSFILFFSFSTIAQNDLSSPIPMDQKVKVGKLKNGLTYYIRENPKPEDKLELRLVINAGSILEEENQLGLAHFMEHMNFNGTKNFEKNDIVDYLQSIGVKFGADLNAYTSFDETVYILPIPSDDPEKLEKGFQILEDWAHQATLTEKDIDEERGVVLEEYRLGLGAEKRMMREYLPKLMYGSMYAERLPIGTKEVLENFEYEDLRSFYRDWYRPDLMAVIAVGDLSADEIEKKIKAHFSKIEMPEKPKERKEFDLPNHEETFIAVASDKETGFTRVELYYKDQKESEPMSTKADYRSSLTKSLFTAMLNNRFQEIANGSNPPYVFASASYRSTFARSKKAYSTFALCSPEQQLEAMKTLLVENKRVKEHGFLASELERAEKDLMARIEKQYNDRDKMESNRILGEYIRHYLSEEPMPGIAWEYEAYKELLPTIKLEEVNELINQFIHDDNRVLMALSADKEGLEKVEESSIEALLEEVEAMAVEPYEDEEVAESLMSEMPKGGTIIKAELNEGLGTTTLTLSNGAKVTYKVTDFKNDEVLFSAYSPGGSSLIPLEELKKSNFAMGSVTSTGLAGMDLTQMQKFQAGKIYRASARVGNYSESMNGSAAPKDLEYLFQTVHLYFTDLNKDEEAYNSEASKMKGFLGNIRNMPANYFSFEVSDYRNKGNDRYFGFPTAEDIESADYEMAYKHFQDRFADASDFEFFFVGNVDEEKIRKYSELYLASLPTVERDDSPKYSTFQASDKKEKYVVNKGTDPKSSVRISWIEKVNYEDMNKLEVIALGEALSIKLIEKLREEESGVYGVGARASLQKYPYGEFTLSISFPCGPENVDKLTEAALGEVAKIKENGITDEDLAKVKENLLLEHKEDLKTNRYWLNHLNKSARENNDPNEMLKFEERVNAMDPQNIHTYAQKFLDENYFQAVLMPEEEKE